MEWLIIARQGSGIMVWCFHCGTTG